VSELKIAIILGSTRPGRNGKAVADWVLAKASGRTGADYELIDLADYPLPHMDEAIPPSVGQYAGEHTKAWAATIGVYDGFIFVTPEYNHSTSGVLKNAIDYLYAEWNNKAATMHDGAAEVLFGQLETWSDAMKSIRSSPRHAAI
jgi:NAD(P)H-dependent FMN reductase